MNYDAICEQKKNDIVSPTAEFLSEAPKASDIPINPRYTYPSNYDSYASRKNNIIRP
jgi:hypothetical protein